MSRQLKVFYSDSYTLPLPPEHRFPIEKYKMLRDRLLWEGILSSDEIFESELAPREILQLAHTPEYVQGIFDGSVAPEILKRIGFPWSELLYRRSAASVGGALSAALSALEYGLAGNLAGGTHHAHADRGEGYCVFNDIAVVTRYLKKNQLRKRIAIVDLDVHQGNGNSSILSQDAGVFIFSMHGEKNYPFKKIASHLDIALADGTGDVEFLEQLDRGLEAIAHFEPDYIFYQTGVDPLKEDSLGKLNLSFEGLMERDRRVLQFCKSRHIPVSLALGGGYAKPIELSVEAYTNTYRVVRELGW